MIEKPVSGINWVKIFSCLPEGCQIESRGVLSAQWIKIKALGKDKE